MIEICQGTPGSGKSAAAVARAILHLKKGGVVAANFSLVDGWADAIASRYLFSKISDDYRFKKASSLYPVSIASILLLLSGIYNHVPKLYTYTRIKAAILRVPVY
jgi:hypothetical protein